MNMQKLKSLSLMAAALVFFFTGNSTPAETVANPGTPAVIPRAQQLPVWQPEKGQTMLEALKAYQKLEEDDAKWQDEINQDYERIRNSTAVPNPGGDYTPAKDSGPLVQTAKECGEAKQRECAPSKF